MTIARQAPLSMGFPRQEYWSGLPFPSPRDLPDPGMEPRSPTLQADSLPFDAHILGTNILINSEEKYFFLVEVRRRSEKNSRKKLHLT